MKQLQCNALNMKTTAKQVLLYFICRTAWPGYTGTTTNLQIALNAQKNPYLNPCLNLAKKKILAKFDYPKKSRNRKFQTPKNPLIIPITCNPARAPPWALEIFLGLDFCPHLISPVTYNPATAPPWALGIFLGLDFCPHSISPVTCNPARAPPWALEIILGLDFCPHSISPVTFEILSTPQALSHLGISKDMAFHGWGCT